MENQNDSLFIWRIYQIIPLNSSFLELMKNVRRKGRNRERTGWEVKRREIEVGESWGQEGRREKGGRRGKKEHFKNISTAKNKEHLKRHLDIFIRILRSAFQMEKNLPPNYCYFLFQAQNKHTNCNTNSPAWQENMSPKHFNQWLLPGYKRLGTGLI